MLAGVSGESVAISDIEQGYLGWGTVVFGSSLTQRRSSVGMKTSEQTIRVISPLLTVVDLFAGAGGLSLGFEKAGFRTLWAADHNVAAAETFKCNLGGKVECAEINTDTNYPRPTVIIGGPPCQGFSSAGMRKTGDERNTLVSVFAQIVARVKPEAFVFENVEGLLTSEQGERIYELLQPLITAGYRIHLRKINAANFGVPQHRKRVLAIGGLGFDPTFPEPTHSAFGAPGAHLAGAHLLRTTTVEEAIRDLPQPAARAPGRPTDHYSGLIDAGRLHKIKALKPGQTMRDLPKQHWHESYPRRAYRRVKDGTPTERRGGPPTGIRRLRSDEPSKTITGGASSEFIHPSEDRALTLRECARLQTFPDDFVFHGTRAARAMLIGNAVPPRLAEVVARGLVLDLQTQKEEAKPGALLSFVPSLASGTSPALRHVTDRITASFRLTSQQQLEFS